MRDFARLIGLLRPYALWVTGGIVMSTAVVLTNVGLLALSGWFIAAMALAGHGGPGIEYFAPAAGIRGLAIARTVGRYLERVVTHEATFRLIARMRVWFYERLEPLAPARLQYHRGGDLLSRIRADIDSLDNLYLRVVAPTIAAAVAAILMVAFITLWSPSVALIDAVALGFAGAGLPILVLRLGRSSGRHAVQIRADLRASVSDTVRGLGEMLVYGASEGQRARFMASSVALAAVQRRQAIITAASTALSGLVAQLAMWGALVIAIPLVARGSLSGPDLAMIAFFILASFEAIGPLPLAFQTLGETLAAARRIFEIVDSSPAVHEPNEEASPPCHFGLRIERLRMRYAEAAPWALNGLDLEVRSGRSLAILGASGSGKTSIFNVLLRFWDYQDGRVEIGGVSLKSLNGDTARRLFSVVAQQTFLFNASVRDNLLVARPDADDADVLAALRKAEILDEILAMPEGIDTFVGETGVRFSGGQARRVAIARAFLKDAPLLLLDEPTDGLDLASEDAVLRALAGLMKDRTTLLITHRLQALRYVDEAVTLSRGRLVPGGERSLPEVVGLKGDEIFDPILGAGCLVGGDEASMTRGASAS